MGVLDDPFVVSPSEEVSPHDALPVRSMAQVCFQRPLDVEGDARISAFSEAIRSSYPVQRQEWTPEERESPEGGATDRPLRTYWLEDEEKRWRVSLAPEYLALDAAACTSRSAFVSRLRDIAVAFEKHVGPEHVERLRVRCLDGIVSDTRDEIAKLVRAEMRGIAGTRASARALHTRTESLFALDQAYLVTRWGQMSAEAAVDAAAREAASRSWVLDIEMCSAEAFRFSVDRLVAEARRFTERIHAFWRWAVTDEYLQHHGRRSCLRGDPGLSLVASGAEWPWLARAIHDPWAGVPAGCMRPAEPNDLAALASPSSALLPPAHVATEPAVTGEQPASAAIAELRRLSGLTWEQLARLFQVTRRSLHFWASGKPMTPAHRAHLDRLLATVRQIDRGSAGRNRELLTARRDGTTALELLAAGEYDRVLALVGPGEGRARVRSPRVAQEVVAARAPRPPEELAGALQDRVHVEKAGRVIARPIDVSRKQ